MTYLRSISRFVVVLMVLAGITAAAVPAGWIALRYEAPGADEQKGHWIIVKAPADGLGRLVERRRARQDRGERSRLCETTGNWLDPVRTIP